MDRYIERVDIETSIYKVFKYKKYKDKGYIPIIILENEEVVDLSNYEATVYFKFPNKQILSSPCIINNNVIEVPLEKENFTKEEKVLFEIVFVGNEQIVTTFKMYLDI